MTPDEYVTNAVRTKSDRFYAPTLLEGAAEDEGCRGIPTIAVDVLHSLVGISTEAGELLDVAKKAMFYGKAVDYVNLDEEMGDVLWYVAIYCRARGVTIEELMERNIAKLRVRFPHCFTEELAESRDLDAERAVLEMRPTMQDAANDENVFRQAIAELTNSDNSELGALVEADMLAYRDELLRRFSAFVGKPLVVADAKAIIQDYYAEKYGQSPLPPIEARTAANPSEVADGRNSYKSGRVWPGLGEK